MPRRPLYAELAQQVERLTRELAAARTDRDELRNALRAADRRIYDVYGVRCVVVPLTGDHRRQVEDEIEEARTFNDCRTDAEGNRHYEEFAELDQPLPGTPYYLVRYSTDSHGDPISNTSIWALVPTVE